MIISDVNKINQIFNDSGGFGFPEKDEANNAVTFKDFKIFVNPTIRSGKNIYQTKAYVKSRIKLKALEYSKGMYGDYTMFTLRMDYSVRKAKVLEFEPYDVRPLLIKVVQYEGKPLNHRHYHEPYALKEKLGLDIPEIDIDFIKNYVSLKAKQKFEETFLDKDK